MDVNPHSDPKSIPIKPTNTSKQFGPSAFVNVENRSIKKASEMRHDRELIPYHFQIPE